jgi:ribosomal protein S27AE
MNARPKRRQATLRRVEEPSKPEVDDERPPICPACGVTMGIIVDDDGTTRYVCLECGFSDRDTLL